MEDHHIAAHHVARHLRAIATLLPRLSAQAADPLYDILHADVDVGLFLNQAADAIAATAPFIPLTDEQRTELEAMIDEQCADMNSRERVDSYTDGWTDADWRAEWDDNAEYLNDDLEPPYGTPQCPNTGLPCLAACNQKECAGMRTPLNEWPRS